MSRFDKVLVANRGEIAVRVLRSARALGYRTVAVYSDADADAPHVALADEAVRIGPSPVRESYLRGEAILEAAARTGSGAVHPGYGFLSENAEFAAACAWAGLTFVGPPVEAIQLMGDKARAKGRMIEAGVPTVPGYQGEDQSDGALWAAAAEVGFPLLVKAAAGGGGRGMRRVSSADELARALSSARAEAENAFGDGTLLLERLVVDARHVEVQVFADAHGNVIHLGERDCSVQRRYQKVIEECPSPAVDAELRARMGEAGAAAAAAIGYLGAGTVEFLLDRSGAFYFLEMNTRLQVEHPVTEMVTGLDLVALQLEVAAGKPLPLRQEELSFRGHAIEVRLYAEDPYAGYLPQTGRVLGWRPAEGPGLRCDHGVREGQEVSPFYDPMLGKLIAHGADREEARRRLVRALGETVFLGLRSNKRFLMDLLGHETFVTGEATTGFLDALGEGSFARPAPGQRLLALAGALWARKAAAPAPGARAAPEPYDGWRTAGPPAQPRRLRVDGEPVTAWVAAAGQDARGAAYTVRLGDEDPLHRCRILAEDGPRLRVEVDGVQETAHAALVRSPAGDRMFLELGGVSVRVEEEVPRGAQAEGGGDGSLRAPTSGRVIAVEVAVGERVTRGQPALLLESMKIESQVACDIDGVVAEVRVSVGAQVDPSHVLVVITPDEAEKEESA